MGLEKELAQVINNLNKGGTKPYDTSAVVKRVEGNTAWVHIDQGVEETPVEMTIACKPGDTVKVRLSGGMAYLLGNNTAPPTDDRTALEALGTAGMARKMAKSAEKVANTTEQHTRPAITSMITYYKLSNGTPEQPTEESHAGWSQDEPEWDPESDEQLYYSVRSRTVQGIITWSNPHVLSSYANLNILQNAILLEVGEGSTVGLWLDSNGEPILDSNEEEIIATLGSITDAYARVQVMANEILSEVSETYVNTGQSNISSLSSVMKQTAAGVDLYATINGAESDTHTHVDNDSFDIVKNGVKIGSFSTDGLSIWASGGSLLASLGYGEGASESGTAYAPFYDLGQRKDETEIGNWSMSEGHNTTASGYISHAEGEETIASGNYSHAEGVRAQATDSGAHAEGRGAVASGLSSHAEGSSTASGTDSHAEGSGTTASGTDSHAEGSGTTASGRSSHAEGEYTIASGIRSHASGFGTYASGNDQFVMGRYNSTNNQYALIIGNGTGDFAYQRKTVFAVDWDGNIHIPAGKQVINDL